MVNFRFHIVSLVAVFLALALGIGMGVTVIDKATVDLLQNRLNAVRADVRSANARSGQLQTQIEKSDEFAQEAGAYLVDGRLDEMGVTVVKFAGVDAASSDQLSQLITRSGGFFRGSITITDRLNLAQSSDVDDLAKALAVSTNDPVQLKRIAIEKVAGVVAGASSGGDIAQLAGAGFITWSPGQNVGELVNTSFIGGRVVVESGPAVHIPNDTGALSLVHAIDSRVSQKVLAVDTGQNATADKPEVRALFTKPIIDDAKLRTSVATVDNIDQQMGRIAAVMALAELTTGKAGHYGVGPGASSVLPPASR